MYTEFLIRINTHIIHIFQLSSKPSTVHITIRRSTTRTIQVYDMKIIFWEKESTEHKLIYSSDINSLIVVVGPEGGFTEKEADQAKQSGFNKVSMGPRVLRAETAAVAACTLIQYIFGDTGKKA